MVIRGTEVFDRMEGTWAVVIDDRRSGEIVVSRDRIGIKPLYAAALPDGTICLASEIKALLRLTPGRPAYDMSVLQRFVERGWLDDVGATLYRDVSHFPPGCVSVWKDGAETQRRFWAIPAPSTELTDVGAVTEVLEDAVAKHFDADAEVATTLSGGIDSTAINGILKSRGAQIHAFSIRAADINDESELIDPTVRAFGVDHDYIDVSGRDYVAEYDRLLGFHDEPTFTAGQVNQQLFRQAIADRGYKVLLVGEGADEVFAGYAKNMVMYLSDLQDNNEQDLLNDALAGAFAITGKTPEALLADVKTMRETGAGLRTVQINRFGAGLLNADHTQPEEDLAYRKTYARISDATKGKRLFTELLDRLTIDIPQVLRNEDRTGMSFGMEVRPVFLDHRVIETAWRFPYSRFMQGGTNKSILRDAMADFLPAHVSNHRGKFRRPGSIVNLVYKTLDREFRRMMEGGGFLGNEGLGRRHGRCL